MIKAEKRKQRTDFKKLSVCFFAVVSLLCHVLTAGFSLAADTAPRLYFSDAKLSFELPADWRIGTSFPFGPLLARKTQEGTDATIVCQISDAIDPKRLSADAPIERLKMFAARDLAIRAPAARTLAGTARTLASQNAYEVTWLLEGNEGQTQYQSVYFFMDNRFYVLTLKTTRDSFPWIVQDYQNWLEKVGILSRRDSGKLATPSLGGLWVHQTGGAKMEIPDDWLIGVSDDRQLGAAIVRDKMSMTFSVVVDALGQAMPALSGDEKQEARQALKSKGRTAVSESEEPFHGLPAFQIEYEYANEGRFIRGQDIWVSSAKARWLISLEGDSKLMRQMTDERQHLFNAIHFYQ
jgi:hypothetical protein